MGFIIFVVLVIVAVILFLGIKERKERDDLIELAKNGDIEAQYLLGKYYFFKAQDIDNAIFWLCVCGEYRGYRQAMDLLNEMEKSGVPRFHERLNNARRKIEQLR